MPRLRHGHLVALATAALLALAVLMVHSATMTVGQEPMRVADLLTGRYMIHALAAVAAMWLVGRVDVIRILRRPGLRSPLPWLMLLALGLVAVTMLPGVGLTINGARRWLPLGPRSWGITFQPSELVKWLCVACLAALAARRAGRMHRPASLGAALLLLAACCGLVMPEDLGTALLIGVVAGVMLLAAGMRLWQAALVVPPAAAAVTFAIIHSPYRVQRLLTFLDPWADPQGAGYQAIASLAAIAQGGVTGRGLGAGIAKYGYLPADTSDFLFAIVCEELGMGGAALVIGLYLVIFWAGLSIVRGCGDLGGRLLGLGIILTVGLQALINLGVVTVLLPTKGIALPLMSAGGTGWILTAAALGALVSLDRHAARYGEDSVAGEVPRRDAHSEAGTVVMT
jgi:cell division protein FtsW